MAQRKGIQSSRRVILFNKEWKPIIDKLGISNKWDQIPLPMVYLKEYTKENFEAHLYNNSLHNSLKMNRGTFDFVFLSHSRHYWKKKNGNITDDLSNKGNDKLIKAFAQAISIILP